MMRTRTSLVIAASAAVVSIGSIALLGGSPRTAGASQPEFPVVCKVVGNVTFSPMLSKTGTHTTNAGAVTTMTITGGRFNGCLSAAPSGAPNHGSLPNPLVIKFPATSLGRINGVRTYATGYCPSFMTTAPKALRHQVFDVAWSGGGVTGTSVFTTTKVTTATNTSGDVGFTFNGREVTGLFPEKPLNQITAFFDATDSAALATGCASNQTVSTPTFDGSNSVAIL